MDDVQELIAIQQELEGISDCRRHCAPRNRLRKIFPQTHPQFDDVFKDIGAAGYYKRTGWLSSECCDKNSTRWCGR